MKRVLSIDGGGLRGIIPLVTIVEIEKHTGKRACDLFDLIVGTSIGGDIAIMLGLGIPSSDILRIFIEDGERFFKKKKFSFNGFFGAKYDTKNLERFLYEKMGDSLMRDLKCRVICTAYCLETRTPAFFKSYDDIDKFAKIIDVALATSSAPLYFEPHEMHFGYIDGGVVCNNPAVYAMGEATQLFGNDFKLLSLGTGFKTPMISNEKASGFGIVGWASVLFDILFDGVSAMEDSVCRKMLGDRFLRIQKSLDSKINDDLACATEKNRVELHLFSQSVFEERKEDVFNFIQ